jgi:CCR4-NOT transcription complex subunit 7/8
MDNIYWVCFFAQSYNSGYDLGYLLKTMMSVPLPSGDAEFFELLTTFFPSVYGNILLSSSYNRRPNMQ